MKTRNKNRFFSESLRKLNTASQLVFYSLVLSHLTFIPYVHANPAGGNIVGGVGHIHNSALNTVIHQNSASLAINWDSFNLNANERVEFLQPGASSIALNRILDNSGSRILGSIDANGQVILVNPNGIFFGASSQVNVGGLIASGLDISPSDFMNGNYIFNEVLGSNGTVINQGLLNAASGGNITLIGKQIKNKGVISAKLGRVNMAAGRQAFLTFDAAGAIGVKITQEVLQNELGIDPALLNSGEINAEGGQVLLTASVSRDVFSQAVNSGDLSQATSVLVNPDGSFSLKKGANIVNSGTINVSTEAIDLVAGDVVIMGENITQSGKILANTESGAAGSIELHANNKVELIEDAKLSARAESSGTGGKVKVLGNKVGILDNSVVDVSGANGGGEALIGGDRQGKNKNIRNAEFLYLGEKAQIYADALDNGNGGKLITYADNTARIYGNLFARGGINGGNGGFIETSGKSGFEILNAPDASARNGKGGLWLIDPRDITIQATGDSNILPPSGSNPVLYTANGNNATIGVDTIQAALVNFDVDIWTDNNSFGSGNQNGDITFDANVQLDFDGIVDNTRTLRLFAYNDIIFQTGFSIDDSNPAVGTGRLNIVLSANNDGSGNSGSGNGEIVLNAGTIINTRGGNFKAEGINFNSGAATINVGAGSIDLDGVSGAVTLGNLTAASSTQSNLLVQNALSIIQQSGTLINIGQDLLLGDSSTTTISLDQLSNVLGSRIVVKADDVTLNSSGNITLDTGTNITNTLKLTSTTGNLGSTPAGVIIVDNTNNNATATFNTTGNINFANSNNFNQINIVNGNTVTLNDTSGGISLSANNGAGIGGVTGNLTVTVSNGDIADFGEINIAGTTNLTVDSGRSIILDNSNNTLMGLITLSASGGNFSNITLMDTTAIDLHNLNVSNNLNLTADTVNLGRVFGSATSTSANNLSVNTTSIAAGDVITQSSALAVFGNTALGVANTATQNILLNNAANDFNAIDISAANNVSISDIDAIFLDDITVNNLTINAGITGTGGAFNRFIQNDSLTNSAVVVAGTTTLTSRNITSGANYSIELASTANNFNNVNIINASNVVLADNTGAINLQTSNTINSLDVSSTGTVTNGNVIANVGTAGVSVNGAANFVVANNQSINLSGDNTFNIDPVFSSASGNQINNLSVKDLTDYTVQDNLNIQGNLDITANNITLQDTTVGSGDLILTATQLDTASALIGAISQSFTSSDSLLVNGLSTLNARTITLNHSGNDFQGNVLVNNALTFVTLVDSVGGIQLGDASGIYASNTLNVASTGGDITQANSISTAGVSVFDAGSADILFNTSNSNNFTGNISITGARNARINDSTTTLLQAANISNDLLINSGGGLTLGAGSDIVSVGNDLIAATAGAIQQSGTATALTVMGNTRLTARNASNTDQNITLKNTSNRFNTVDIVNAANVDLYDRLGTIGLQGNISGYINIQNIGSDIANSVIYDTAELNVGGAATFGVASGESINLGNIANTFIVDPQFNGAINNLVVSDDTALTFQNNLNLSGDLNVNAQGITFRNTTLTGGNLNASSGAGGIAQVASTSINIAGLTSLDGDAGGISLAGNNDFQNTVTLTTTSSDAVNQPSDVIITDSNLLNIGTSSIDGGLSVTAGSVTQTNDGTPGNGDGIRVANATLFTVNDNSSITLDNIDNQFNSIGFAAKTSGAFLDSVTISNSGALDLQSMNLNNNLTAISSGNITNSAALVINGLTQLSGSDITLDSPGNNFNNITITNGAAVSITDINSVNFADVSTISNTLNVTAQNGSISSDASASLQVSNTTSLNSSNGEIRLDNGLHDFNGVQLNSSGNSRITDVNTIDILNSIIGGDLTVIADTGTGGVNNNIVNTNGNIMVAGATTLQSSDGGNILLARIGSNHLLNGPISVTSTGSGRLNNVQINNSVASDLRGVRATNLLLNSGGNITESGVLDVSVSTTLSSLVDIDLMASANDNNLNSLIITGANNVRIADAGALTLNSLNVTGQLEVDATGISTAANLSITNGIDLNAGTGALAINNNLTTTTGAITLAADLNINQAAGTELSGPAISLNSSNGNISQNGNITQRSPAQGSPLTGGVNLTAGGTAPGSIIMAASAVTQADDNINYTSTGNQNIASLNSTNGVISSTTSNGAILDANGAADNYTASRVNLRSLTGVGAADSIETRTAALDVINLGINTGLVDIKNSGDVLLINLVNSGNINFNNTSNVTINNVVADFSIANNNGGVTYGGDFIFNVNGGSVFGVNRGAGNEFLNTPDITADRALITVNGAFGTFQRPIVMKLRSELFLLSTISSTFFLGGPPPINVDNSAIQLSIFDSINNVSGQQLIEVESLADIDPAIFTDLHNYDKEEIAIRLPRDQVFEDELDEYDAQ